MMRKANERFARIGLPLHDPLQPNPKLVHQHPTENASIDAMSMIGEKINSATFEALSIPGAEIYYQKKFLPPEEATMLFQTLLAKCAWERRKTSFKSAVPRDEAYYGDPGTSYVYSRREYKPLPWIPELEELKTRVEAATHHVFSTTSDPSTRNYNAVLCNCYRNGKDSVGLHADAEPEMGPIIASLSLGAERMFRLKRQDGTVAFAERLPHGSLLIMAGHTQKNFKHEVPKEPGVAGPRINLTFRRITHK